MKRSDAINKIIAATGGAYSGTIIATGITTLSGAELNTDAWWGWLAYAVLWATLISLPVSLIFMFSVVRFFFRLLVNDSQTSYRHYALVGLIAGSSPVLLTYIITVLYFVYIGASLREFGSTLVPFSYFLLNAALCGVLSLVILYRLSYKGRPF